MTSMLTMLTQSQNPLKLRMDLAKIVVIRILT